MAQTGFSPILLYSSSTASAAPTVGNLTNSTTGSELAINITDGKLFYKDNSGVVQVIAWKTTPTTAGGTGLTSYTAGDLPYYASGSAFSKLGIGTNGYFLTSSGSAPQWTDPTTLAVTSISFGSTGLTPSTATKGAVTVAGTLGVANGGTGLTTLTAGYIPYGNGTSAFGSASTLSYSTTSGLTVNGIQQSYNTTLYSVDGAISNYSSTNGLYVNGNTAGWLALQGDGTQASYIKVYGSTNGSNPNVITFQTNTAERARIDSNGNLLVSCTSLPSSSVAGRAITTSYFQSSCGSTTTSYTHFYFTNGNGNVGTIVTNGLATTYNSLSDYRLKTVIGAISDSGLRIDALEPIEYNWNSGGSARGFLAHKFAEVYPNSVIGEKDAIDEEGNPVYQSMQSSTPEVIADLIAEIQSLRKRVLALEAK
jgi:Chaperone of endosialidase